MTELRVRAYHHFMERPMPSWGNEATLNNIDFDAVTYFLRSSERTERDWDDVPDDIKSTFDASASPMRSRNGSAVSARSMSPKRSTIAFERDLEEQGVIFLDMDSGLKQHEDIVRAHFGSTSLTQTTSSQP